MFRECVLNNFYLKWLIISWKLNMCSFLLNLLWMSSLLCVRILRGKWAVPELHMDARGLERSSSNHERENMPIPGRASQHLRPSGLTSHFPCKCSNIPKWSMSVFSLQKIPCSHKTNRPAALVIHTHAMWAGTVPSACSSTPGIVPPLWGLSGDSHVSPNNKPITDTYQTPNVCQALSKCLSGSHQTERRDLVKLHGSKRATDKEASGPGWWWDCLAVPWSQPESSNAQWRGWRPQGGSAQTLLPWEHWGATGLVLIPSEVHTPFPEATECSPASSVVFSRMFQCHRI